MCLAAFIGIPLYAGRPPVFPNAVKYRDAGAKPATGRSGSAAIEARAMRGQGFTVFEVTTGQLDSGVRPPGSLDKIQLKIFGSGDDPIVNNNFRPPFDFGGAIIVYDWPMPGTRYQIQTNVSGIDPHRTDVVTVEGTVKWRPDLTVASIEAPRQAYAGSVVDIKAVVREANGDLGARGNCVLKIDGAIVDRANGIWVDAGDAVTCEFQRVFPSAGRKAITVEVTDVVPLDYDTTNNSKTAFIDIVSTTTPLWYAMDAEDITYDQNAPSRDHEEFTSFSPDYQSYVRDSTGGSTSTTHVAYYGANLQIEKAIEFPVALESRLIVDGQPLVAASGTIDYNPNSFLNFSGDGYWNKCGDSWDGWHWFFVCHFHSEFDGVVRDLTTAYSGANAGTVTYTSWGTSETRYANGVVDVYTYNGTYDYVSGELLSPMPASLGNHVTVHAAFTDAADKHFETEASVDLFPFPDVTYDYGEYCYNYDYAYDAWGRFTGYQCLWPVTVGHGKSGLSWGVVQQ